MVFMVWTNFYVAYALSGRSFGAQRRAFWKFKFLRKHSKVLAPVANVCNWRI